MRLLLDTHIVLNVVAQQTDSLPLGIRRLLADRASGFHVSVVSLWEIAIKWRLGKLPLTVPIDQLPDLIAGLRIELVPINERNVLAAVEPEPPTRDPFDRLLLAQCQIEDLRLVTIDRALVSHPLAAKPGKAGRSSEPVEK